MSDRPLGSAAERRGENPLPAVGANVPAGQALPFITLSFFSPRVKAPLTSFTFTRQHRNSPYILNSTVSFEVLSMPYRVQPSRLPKRATSVG